MAGGRVQVGASYARAWVVVPGLLAVAGLGWGVLAYLGSNDPSLAAAMAAPGAAAAVWFVTQLVRVVRDRRWLEPTSDGVTLTDRYGTRDVADADIVDLGTAERVVYSNGVPSTRRRDGFLVVADADGGERVVRVEYASPLAGPDPLGPWLERVFAGLVARANAALAAGGRLVGDDWALAADRLTAGAVELPLAEVAAVDRVDGKVCVWPAGATEPLVRVPADGANALVLLAVLAERVAGRSAPPAPAGGLGRLLFERANLLRLWRRVGSWLAVGLLTVCVFGAAAGGLLAPNPPKDPGGLLAGCLLIGALAVGLAAHLWTSRACRLRVYEAGLTFERGGRVRTLLWADAGGYTHSAVRRYVKGAYAGTAVWLRFDPVPGTSGERITYSATVQNADDELDRLRDRASRAVAGRLEARLAAGEAVPWLPGAVFTPAGLEVRRRGWLGRKPAEVVPYHRTGNYIVREGTFRLTLPGERRPAVKGSTAAKDFFPGLELLHRLAAPATAEV